MALPEKNEPQYAARKAFDPIADAIRGLYKLTARVADLAGSSSRPSPSSAAG